MHDKEYKGTVLREDYYNLSVQFSRKDGVDWVTLAGYRDYGAHAPYCLGSFKVPLALVQKLAKDVPN